MALFPVATLAVVVAVVMLIGVVVGLLRGASVAWLAVPGAVVTVLLALFAYQTNHAFYVDGAGRWVAPLLGVASIALVASRWGARPRKT